MDIESGSPEPTRTVEGASYDPAGVTYRCRLYKIHVGQTTDSAGVFAEFWDTLQLPARDIPSEEPVHVITSDSWVEARKTMNDYLQEHNIVLFGVGHARGSF